MRFRIAILACVSVAALHAERITLRVGFFPNVTHAQGVIGSQTTREKRGWFETRLGPEVAVQWLPFNAGPSVIEGIFAGSIDLAYVGPNPALNGYIRTNGEEVRVLAGAAEGGAALVVAANGPLKTAADFRGKRIGTPQLGNTQDVAARAWLKRQGFKITLVGGDATVLPAANPDLLQLFRQQRIDAVWTIEPWVSRLELEAGGKVFLEQSDAVTTVLIGSVRFLKARPALAERFCRAHFELTEWLGSHASEAREIVRAGLSAEIRREMPAAIVDAAWRRLRFTTEVKPAQFTLLVADAQGAGFLRNAIPLDRLFSGKP